MTFRDPRSPELLRRDESGHISKTSSLTVSYLKNLSSTILNSLCNGQDVDNPILRKHLVPQVRHRFQSDESDRTMSRFGVKLVDVQVDLDELGSKARTWCLNSRGFQESLSRESVAVLDWQLDEHKVWVCIDIKVVSGGVSF